MIIPKRSVRDLFEVDEQDLLAIVRMSQRLAKAMRQAWAPDGIQVVQYNGAAAGQTVFHYHMHLIPVWAGEAMAHHGGGAADFDELLTVAAQLREALDV